MAADRGKVMAETCYGCARNQLDNTCELDGLHHQEHWECSGCKRWIRGDDSEKLNRALVEVSRLRGKIGDLCVEFACEKASWLDESARLERERDEAIERERDLRDHALVIVKASEQRMMRERDTLRARLTAVWEILSVESHPAFYYTLIASARAKCKEDADGKVT